MAPSGYRQFANREIATSDNVQNYLMDQAVTVHATEAARDSAISSPAEGMVCTTNDTGTVWRYDGTDWVDIYPGNFTVKPTITAANWAVYSGGGGFCVPTITRRGNLVVMIGLVTAATNPGGVQTLFTLAAEYRPQAQLISYRPDNSGATQALNIQEDGDVRIYNPGAAVAILSIDHAWTVA